MYIKVSNDLRVNIVGKSGGYRVEVVRRGDIEGAGFTRLYRVGEYDDLPEAMRAARRVWRDERDALFVERHPVLDACIAVVSWAVLVGMAIAILAIA